MDIDPNKFFGNWTFGSITLWLLAFGGIVTIVDFIGFLPPGLAKWLARNRLEATLKSLKQLGVRVCWNEESNTVSFFERALDAAKIKEAAYKIRLRELLTEDTYEATFNVGSTRMFTSPSFVDAMGSSTSIARALEFAKILNTHANVEGIKDFEIVACPKAGSPVLGYEFSRLTGRSLVLGVLEKVTDIGGTMGAHAALDFPKSLSLRGKKILVVDDSTTGGRKMIELIEALRKEGATISDALVLFEPKGKGAREALSRVDVQLHSVIEGPDGRF